MSLVESALQRPPEKAQLRLALRSHIRSGQSVFEAEDLAIGYPPLARTENRGLRTEDSPLSTQRSALSTPHVLAHCPDLEIERAERVALIGPNGVGKTTLLKTIMGNLRPLAGHLLLMARQLRRVGRPRPAPRPSFFPTVPSSHGGPDGLL